MVLRTEATVKKSECNAIFLVIVEKNIQIFVVVKCIPLHLYIG